MSIRDGAAGFVAKLVAAVDYREGERHLQDVLTGDALYARFFGAKYLVQCFMCPTFFIDKVKFKLLILDTLLGSIKQGLSSNAEVCCLYYQFNVVRRPVSPVSSS